MHCLQLAGIQKHAWIPIQLLFGMDAACCSEFQMNIKNDLETDGSQLNWHIIKDQY